MAKETELPPCAQCGRAADLLLAEPAVALCRRCADELGQKALAGS